MSIEDGFVCENLMIVEFDDYVWEIGVVVEFVSVWFVYGWVLVGDEGVFKLVWCLERGDLGR